MGEVSKISWTSGTFNIAWGCTEVGEGCTNCYARELAARFGYGWGDDSPRRYFGDKHWNDPIRWNRKAEKSGKRMKVFCSSMADIFDNKIDQAVRDRLWELIAATPWLDWQLCTKRIGNARSMFPHQWFGVNELPRNIWLGITVVNQEEADRDIPKLVKNFTGTLWLSIEPMLGPISLDDYLIDGVPTQKQLDGPKGMHYVRHGAPQIDWVVCGGESGNNHRMLDIEWARSIIEQCKVAGVACFIKQDSGDKPGQQGRFTDEEWAIKEFPTTKGG